MRVYKRANGSGFGFIYRAGKGNCAQLLREGGKWVDSSWENERLTDPHYFKLVGKSFKLKK